MAAAPADGEAFVKDLFRMVDESIEGDGRVTFEELQAAVRDSPALQAVVLGRRRAATSDAQERQMWADFGELDASGTEGMDEAAFGQLLRNEDFLRHAPQIRSWLGESSSPLAAARLGRPRTRVKLECEAPELGIEWREEGSRLVVDAVGGRAWQQAPLLERGMTLAAIKEGAITEAGERTDVSKNASKARKMLSGREKRALTLEFEWYQESWDFKLVGYRADDERMLEEWAKAVRARTSPGFFLPVLIDKLTEDTTFRVGEQVEYLSSTYQEWIEAEVQRVHSDGTVTLDVRERADPAKVRRPLRSPRARRHQALAPPPAPSQRHYFPRVATSGASRQWVHVAPDGKRIDFTPQDNALIAEAELSGAPRVRINDVNLPSGATLQFEVRFGAEARSQKLPGGSKTGICQVNLANGNTRVVERKNPRLAEGVPPAPAPAPAPARAPAPAPAPAAAAIPDRWKRRKSTDTGREYLLVSDGPPTVDGFDQELDAVYKGLRACREGATAFLCKQRKGDWLRSALTDKPGGHDRVFWIEGLPTIYDEDYVPTPYRIRWNKKRAGGGKADIVQAIHCPGEGANWGRVRRGILREGDPQVVTPALEILLTRPHVDRSLIIDTAGKKSRTIIAWGSGLHSSKSASNNSCGQAASSQ